MNWASSNLSDEPSALTANLKCRAAVLSVTNLLLYDAEILELTSVSTSLDTVKHFVILFTFDTTNKQTCQISVQVFFLLGQLRGRFSCVGEESIIPVCILHGTTRNFDVRCFG